MAAKKWKAVFETSLQMMQMRVLLLGMFLFCCARSVMADDPIPTTWPVRFHALQVQNFSGELAVMDLWYDWGKGGNLHVIQKQLGSTTHDMEWTNGTSFFWDAEAKTCRTVVVGVGILRPDWLHDAEYLGVRERNGFTCNVWEKLDFITYYEDVKSKKPVYWIFYTGREVHIISFEEGVALTNEKWQAPGYCFSDEDATVGENSLIHTRKAAVPTEYREWLLSGSMSA